MKKSFILIGAGGHGRVLLELARALQLNVIGATDMAPEKKGTLFQGIPVLGNDAEILNFSPTEVALINGIGSVRPPIARQRVYETLKQKGYHFPSLIHPSAIIASDVKIGEGAQVMAGTILQTGVEIGANTIVNSGAIVDHECRIGAHTHLAPGVTLSGNVIVEPGCHIGTGATLIQGVCIGEGVLIAAGAVVIKPIAPGKRVAGIPAKLI